MVIPIKSKEERAVYMALNPIFSGHWRNIRDPVQIRALIYKNVMQDRVAALLGSFEMGEICESAQTLLRDEIFGNKKTCKKRAAQRFSNMATCRSDLEPASTTLGSNQPAATPPQTAPSTVTTMDQQETNASKTPVQTNNQGMCETESSLTTAFGLFSGLFSKSATSSTMESHEELPNTDDIGSRETLSSSMLDISYDVQHRLMVRVQYLLEQACFEYAQKHLPHLLQRNNWSCPEAMELHIFERELRELNPEAKSKGRDKALPPATHPKRAIQIRHAAVHRERMSAHMMGEMLHDGEKLLEELGDMNRRDAMAKLRTRVHGILIQLDAKEKSSDEALEEKRREFERKRRALQQVEEAFTLQIKTRQAKFRGSAARGMFQAANLIGDGRTASAIHEAVDFLLILLVAAWNMLWNWLAEVVSRNQAV
ncbi:hypothetical protein B0I35DRAFT_445893 [Stachybotrys elegans]|uniref:Uncharacterized protein n=1 Tax=Stachybotrys elegans TaxID=80388 RepID=A0A8K0WKJ5_9HYPO|nr:hypothetical protein B0I35DRAFT_445893 [Stachybotrys elegans]